MPKFLVLAIAIVVILIPGALLAQEELSLESLHRRLQAAESLMLDLTPRVEALEELFVDPWSPDAINVAKDVCMSPLHTEEETTRGAIHQKTADAYRSTYGVSINPDDAYWHSISFASTGSRVYIEYAVKKRKVTELWANCQFIGHSEWTDAE